MNKMQLHDVLRKVLSDDEPDVLRELLKYYVVHDAQHNHLRQHHILPGDRRTSLVPAPDMARGRDRTESLHPRAGCCRACHRTGLACVNPASRSEESARSQRRRTVRISAQDATLADLKRPGFTGDLIP